MLHVTKYPDSKPVRKLNVSLSEYREVERRREFFYFRALSAEERQEVDLWIKYQERIEEIDAKLDSMIICS